MLNKRGRFMRVSVDLLDMIDYSKPYEMQLALTLLYKGSATYFTWGDAYIETTPTMLIQTFGNYTNINSRQLGNVVSALTDMRDRGLIAFNGDIKPKDFIRINTADLIELSQQNEYVELLTEDFYAIMESNNKIVVDKKEIEAKDGYESLLLQAFIGVKARWNFKTIDMLAEFDNGEITCHITDDDDLQQAKGVFCSDSLDFIRTHKHYSLDKIENWCDDRYLAGYLAKLVELGCIKVYTRKMKFEDGMPKTHNFYYEPNMSFEAIDIMVRQYAKRYKYMIDQHEEPKEPKRKTMPVKEVTRNEDDVFSRRRFGRRFR